MTQSTALAMPDQTFTVKVGKNERQYQLETVLAIGHKMGQHFMQEAAFASAVTKAKHGRYSAAVEIMSFGATPSQIKGLAPAAGADWTKARVGMLAELIIERKAPEKGWAKRALVGRAMAELVRSLVNGVPTPDTPADKAADAELKLPEEN